jgi:hypothetical protein
MKLICDLCLSKRSKIIYFRPENDPFTRLGLRDKTGLFQYIILLCGVVRVSKLNILNDNAKVQVVMTLRRWGLACAVPLTAPLAAAAAAAAAALSVVETLGEDERGTGNAIVPLRSGVDEKGAARLQDCVLVLPEMLSARECAQLREEADALVAGGGYTRDLFGEDGICPSLRRVSVDDMSAGAGQISRALLEGRVLPSLEREFPEVLAALGLEGFRGGTLEWASDEPTVNRYTRGGSFEPHEDAYSLSCIVLLSDDFVGGGTRFWPGAARSAVVHDDDDGNYGNINIGGSPPSPSKDSGESTMTTATTPTTTTSTRMLKNEGSSVLVQPRVGTALLFNGDITHAGNAVTSGVRHLFVGSFDVCNH